MEVGATVSVAEIQVRKILANEKKKTALHSIAVGRSVDRGLRTLVLVTKRLPDRDSYTLRFYHPQWRNSS